MGIFSHKNEPSVSVEEQSTTSSLSQVSSSTSPVFPKAFNVYYDHSKKLTNAVLQLGEHQAQPQYAVTVHTAWSGKATVTLHSGAEDSAPALGSAESAGLGLTETTLSVASTHVSERMHVHHHRTSDSYTFAAGGAGRFEWRQSHGDDVRALGGYSWGWKLMRLDEGDGDDEVVAVLADNNKPGHKVARFGFVGSGAAGTLGDEWAIMAVLGALWIWQSILTNSAVAAAVA
nr:hypothetical protein CFP56_71450 [Quercus suber]